MSWVHQAGGYDLLCNRDEKRTRGIAAAPRIAEQAGVRYVAPVDADHGGSWIAVNEFGIGICLLNGAPALPHPGSRSRGLLIYDLIWARSTDDCTFLLHNLDLSPYAPFQIACLEPNQPAVVVEWDGASLAHADTAAMPLISSSYDLDGVRRARLSDFHRCVAGRGSLDARALLEFHASHAPRPDAYSPCMHRPDAHTVSLSWISVRPADICFRYVPGPPCRRLEAEQRVLARAA